MNALAAAGGDPVTAPDGYLDVLDPRFPIRLSMPESLFWELVALRPDRPCADGQAARARQQAARQEERYVTPAPPPEQAHEDTIVDFRLTDGDRFRPEDTLIAAFPGEGEVRPEDTDTFLIVSDRALAEEIRAAERRPLRRAWRWIRGT